MNVFLTDEIVGKFICGLKKVLDDMNENSSLSAELLNLRDFLHGIKVPHVSTIEFDKWHVTLLDKDGENVRRFELDGIDVTLDAVNAQFIFEYSLKRTVLA